MGWLLRHLRGNAVAYLALFVALSAGAYAAAKQVAPKNSVRSKSIKNGQVKRVDLDRGAVGSENLATGAVKGQDLAAGSVGSGELADGAVGVADLAADAKPDRDLDLVRAGPISVDDPAPDINATLVTLLDYGPFSIRATCRDNGSSVIVTFSMLTTEDGHHTTSPVSPDSFTANLSETLPGESSLTANNTTSSAVNALTVGGRFLSVGIMVVARPSGSSPDCVFHLSGYAA